ILFQALEGITLPAALEVLLADREGLQAWGEAPVGWLPERPVWASFGTLLGHRQPRMHISNDAKHLCLACCMEVPGIAGGEFVIPACGVHFALEDNKLFFFANQEPHGTTVMDFPENHEGRLTMAHAISQRLWSFVMTRGFGPAPGSSWHPSPAALNWLVDSTPEPMILVMILAMILARRPNQRQNLVPHDPAGEIPNGRRTAGDETTARSRRSPRPHAAISEACGQDRPAVVRRGEVQAQGGKAQKVPQTYRVTPVSIRHIRAVLSPRRRDQEIAAVDLRASAAATAPLFPRHHHMVASSLPMAASFAAVDDSAFLPPLNAVLNPDEHTLNPLLTDEKQKQLNKDKVGRVCPRGKGGKGGPAGI
ncbi:MAG: hypothetical protein BJ554DRAFT_4510, partial [Olpidium bornovanus]